MIIDFHTHMFPEKIAKGTLDFLSSVCHTKPYTNGTYTGLVASAKQAGANLCIALPVVTKPSQFHSVNAFAAEHIKGTVISFGGIHPDTADYKSELKRIQDMGLRGIKLHPDYQEVPFNDIRYKRIVEYASSLGLIVSVHAGRDPKCPQDVHCTPRMALEVIREVRPEKLVLAHMGGFQMWDEVEECLVGRPVYFDTGVVLGSMTDEQFIRLARSHGTDKILFATDSPWASQSGFVEYLNQMALTDEEKESIFSQNALRLLGDL